LYYNKISDILDQIRRAKTKKDKIEALKINKDNLIFKKILQYTFSSTVFPVEKFEPKTAKNEYSVDHNFDVIDNLFVMFTINPYISNELKMRITSLLEMFDKTTQNIVNMMLKHDLECGIDRQMLVDVFGFAFRDW